MIKIFAILLASSLAGAQSDLIQKTNQHRIVGGENATKNEIPFQVSLQFYYGSHICGGSVISMHHVLTAAHCVILEYPFIFDSSRLRVVAGTNDLEDCGEEPCAQVRFISYIITHENYNKFFDNDIALLVLTKPFVESPSLKAIELRTDPTRTDEKCMASGWGRLRTNGNLPTILQKVTLPIFDYANCSLEYPTYLTDRMICAGGTDAGGKDTCQGDSGGPLVCNGTIAGITSFGRSDCAAPRVPGVYTEVAKFDSWIKNKMAGFVCEVSQKIIAGDLVDISTIPYQVSIHDVATGKWVYKCSGVLISLKHVLTTSQCTLGLPQYLVVVAGATVLTNIDTDRMIQSREVVEAERTGVDSNAISILILKSEFNKTAKVSHINSVKTVIKDCDTCSVSGWANAIPGTFDKYALMKVNVNIQNLGVCKSMSNMVEDGNICTFNKGPAPCYGDQGAPLVCGNNVVAIVSANNVDCTNTNTPSIYVDVDFHSEWIKKVVNSSGVKSPTVFLILVSIVFKMI